MYGVGWTQHTLGAQYIRAGSIIQLLLGKIGRPGGGIYALRGHASIQGSTDVPTLFNLLPGYLPVPDTTHEDLAGYLASVRGRGHKGFWGNGDHGTYRSVMDMIDGKVSGYFLLGQNPAVGSAHGRLQRLGMANLDWLVVRDLTMIESATFWKDSPEIETGEIVPERCGPRCSSSRPPRTWKSPAPSPRPSGCSSGATRPSSPPVTSVPSCGSSTTSAGSCRRSWRAPPTSGTARCSTWPGTTRSKGTSRPPLTCCGTSAASTWPPAGP